MATRAEIIDSYFREKNYYPHVPYVPIGENVVRETERQGVDGLYVSTGAAMVEKESGGKPIFGCDFGSRYADVPPFCQIHVTKARVEALIRNYYTPPIGGANGVAWSQITSIEFVEEAQRLGGAHLPGPNLRVGFRVLLDNILWAQANGLSWTAGAAAYNAGRGGWAKVVNTYGADMARLERQWAARLANASDNPGGGNNGGSGEDDLARDVEAAIAFMRQMIGAPYGTGWEEGTWPDLSPLYARITESDPASYYRKYPVICTGAINVVRYEIKRLPALGRNHGDAFPGGTAALWRQYAHAPGSKPYPLVANTPRGWLVVSPYVGPALRLQGHVGIALGDGRLLEARVPVLTENRTEDQVHRALMAGGGRGNERIVPPSIWLRK